MREADSFPVSRLHDLEHSGEDRAFDSIPTSAVWTLVPLCPVHSLGQSGRNINEMAD